jgi:hypothetical protein
MALKNQFSPQVEQMQWKLKRDEKNLKREKTLEMLTSVEVRFVVEVTNRRVKLSVSCRPGEKLKWKLLFKGPFKGFISR